MFCTSKERETCDVEKRGCDGCYYNKDGDYMNEEEIEEFIDQVNGVEREYKHKPIREKNVENIGMAIQITLNLYQQEKEKNKELVKVIKNVREMHDVKCKVIDMIVEYLVSCDFDEMCGELEQPCMMRWNCRDDIEMRTNCIEQYYFKKARGEENVKD